MNYSLQRHHRSFSSPLLEDKPRTDHRLCEFFAKKKKKSKWNDFCMNLFCNSAPELIRNGRCVLTVGAQHHAAHLQQEKFMIGSSLCSHLLLTSRGSVTITRLKNCIGCLCKHFRALGSRVHPSLQNCVNVFF